MKKFSRIIALVLAFVMIAGSAASVFAFTAEQVSENWYDGSIDKLYAWGIINKEHRVTAQTNPEEKLDRHIFALWIARILTHEFGEDIWWEVDNKTSDSDDFSTGYTDVDTSEEELYRRAIAYVTANGLFEGYGADSYVNAEGVTVNTNEFGPKDHVELYQACKVIMALLTRWKDEFNTTYLDDVLKYDEYLGDNTLRSRGTAYLWKSLSLGVVDKVYMENCTEYFWDAELTYGEAAYLLVKAVTEVKPAECEDTNCTDCDVDTNDNGIGDCYVADAFEIVDIDTTYVGIVRTHTGNDVLGTEDVTVAIVTGPNTFVEITFTAEEFAKAAILNADDKVSLEAGDPDGYSVNTVVAMGYLGNILLLDTDTNADGVITTADFTTETMAELKEGFMNACTNEYGEDVANSIVPTGNDIYSTYLVHEDKKQSVLPEGVADVEFVYNEAHSTVTYKGTEYTIVEKYSEKTNKNEIVLSVNGVITTDAATIKAYIRTLAEGEMLVVFGDLTDDGIFDIVDFKSAEDFADLHTALNVNSGVKGEAYSYILFDRVVRTSIPTNRAFASTYLEGAGMSIVLADTCVENGKVAGYYTTTTVYTAANVDAGFEAIRSEVVTAVEAAGDYYKVTFANGKTALIPTEAKLADDTMAEEFFYTVAGAWSSKEVLINTADNSWFADLASAYAAMTDAKTQLVQRQLTVVLDENGKAIHVVVDSDDFANDVLDAGYVSGFEADGNTATITLNTVGVNGVITSETYTVNLALSATYGYDVAALVEALKANLVEATPADKYAALSQLIFVGVKNDGLGNNFLVAVGDEAMTLTPADTTTTLVEDKLVSSTVSSSVDATFVAQTDYAKEFTFTPELLDKNVNTITNVYTTVEASGYAYMLVDGAYKLVPANVYYTTKTVVQTLNAKVDFEETYWVSDVYDKEGNFATPDDTMVVYYEIVVDGNVIPAQSEVKFSDLVKYQTETAYDEFYYDDGLNVGMFTSDNDHARFYIFDDAEGNKVVRQLVGMKHYGENRAVIYEKDENGNFAYEETDPVYGTKTELTLDGDKYVSADGDIVVNETELYIASNVAFTATEMTVKHFDNATVTTDVIDVEGYKVYFITPCDEEETFHFENAIAVEDLADAEIIAVEYVVDAAAKTVTIFGSYTIVD